MEVVLVIAVVILAAFVWNLCAMRSRDRCVINALVRTVGGTVKDNGRVPIQIDYSRTYNDKEVIATPIDDRIGAVASRVGDVENDLTRYIGKVERVSYGRTHRSGGEIEDRFDNVDETVMLMGKSATHHIDKTAASLKRLYDHLKLEEHLQKGLLDTIVVREKKEPTTILATMSDIMSIVRGDRFTITPSPDAPKKRTPAKRTTKPAPKKTTRGKR